MTELRYLLPDGGAFPILQYRVLMPAVDITGALCPGNGWSEWKAVPYIKEPQEKQNDK